MLPRLLRGVAVTAAIAGLAYLSFARRCISDFKDRAPNRGGAQPPVTILKPLYGDEPELYDNLRSFCEQAYPDFRVVFGVNDQEDPAHAVATAVRDSLPASDIVITVGVESAANPKVANLLKMATEARGEIFVIADSDMRVGPTYLPEIVASFSDAQVGAVTCLYRGRPRSGVAAVLGAMFINSYFAPSVLVASQLQGIAFALGATIAIRRSVLEGVGGFAVLAPHLADDYELGRLTQAAGYDIRIAQYVVENVVTEPSLSTLIEHELRWARTIAAVRPLGYAFSGVTFPLTWALLYLMLGGRRRRGLMLVAAAFASRARLQKAAYGTLGVSRNDPLWLIPARDTLAFAIWIASFFGRGVRWRERAFDQERGGRLQPKERPR
ncbi:MAG: bacteriohopanetetrol glucosamine biosynthesis glycosyltransferase HpnI [Candidatus Eremiobacteraeota bacterium]|nr:bacteriohopanetetrol glucosamine biosynthesis glycosyltransferase HpnI [Candidatus Eremiobacteraeota bacterium]